MIKTTFKLAMMTSYELSSPLETPRETLNRPNNQLKPINTLIYNDNFYILFFITNFDHNWKSIQPITSSSLPNAI